VYVRGRNRTAFQGLWQKMYDIVTGSMGSFFLGAFSIPLALSVENLLFPEALSVMVLK